MTSQLLAQLAIFVISAFLGFELISRVPNLLHTPLMSATNATHGIVLWERSSRSPPPQTASPRRSA